MKNKSSPDKAVDQAETEEVVKTETEEVVDQGGPEVDTTAQRNLAVRRAMAAFGAALPGQAHASGHHAFEEGGEEHPGIPDGKYRVVGSDWAGRFEGGRLVEAFRCVPPHFGGDDVEIIN